MAKKIAIIDDRKDRYKYYRRIVEEVFVGSTIIPIDNDYQNFKKMIQTYFAIGVSDSKKNKLKKDIQEYLTSDLDGFIVDYELEEDRSTICNGMHFYEHFIKNNDFKNKYILFVSGCSESLLKSLKDLIKNINKEGGKANYIPIPANNDSNETFRVIKNEIGIFFDENDNNMQQTSDTTEGLFQKKI
jgi:hypothetical protein